MTIQSGPSTAPKTPPIHAMRREFRDFDEFAEAIQGWGLDWVQLDSGPLDARLEQITTPFALLTRFRFSRKFFQRGTTPPGVRTFGIIGEQSPDVEWCGNTGKNNHILAFPANDEFQAVSHPGFHGDAVSISEDHIRSVAETMGLPDPLDGIPDGLAFVEIEPRHQVDLRNSISKLHSTVTACADGLLGASVLFDLELHIVSALVAALESSRGADAESPEPNLRARAIRNALDYIEDHADKPPSVQDICKASGMSWRTLDYAFRDRFGVTPKKYLQATRLQRVRLAILSAEPGTSILKIASDWGFWHMGQFAADYKRQFGELPSETRRYERSAGRS